MRKAASEPVDLPTLKRLLRLRFARREALLDALLEAVTGQRDLGALDPASARRLQALLESRDDAALEAIARRGHPGQVRMAFQFEALFDGVPTAAERAAMGRRLLELLRSYPWPAATLELRSLVLSECDVDVDVDVDVDSDSDADAASPRDG